MRLLFREKKNHANKSVGLLLAFTIFSIIVGLLTRLFLVWKLAIWHDEIFSILAARNTFSSIISGSVDPVHTPAYYLFLKIWLLMWDNLFWARTSSILSFIVNIYLLYKVGKNIIDKKFAHILVYLYVLSGYFIIFDTTVRMYSGTLTFILLSYYFTLKVIQKPRLTQLLILTVINAVGLYWDYSFIWYFFPLLLIFLYYFVKKSLSRRLLISYIISVFIYLIIWVEALLKNFNLGIEGIRWMRVILKPQFFIPYFIGTHSNVIYTIVIIITLSVGLVKLITTKDNLIRFKINLLVFPFIISFGFTYAYSLLFSPLFHVRSLQIFGLSILMLCALALYNLHLHRRKILFIFLLFMFCINFILVIPRFLNHPESLVIGSFPWKKVMAKIPTNNDTYILYRKYKPLPPEEWLIEGLIYTLSGKETLASPKYLYREIQPYETINTDKCAPIPNDFVELFSCKNNQ